MSKIVIPRRLFLRGAAGVCVALPLLESLGVRTVGTASAQENKFRFAVFMRQANGVLQEKFWPNNSGKLTKAALEQDLATGDKATGVLAAYAEKLNIIHGLKYNFSGSGCGHADGCFQCLTAANRDGRNSQNTLAMGPSLDWVISQKLDQPGTEPVSLYAGATSSYLGDVILYRGPKERRAGEKNPRNAFNRLFGDAPTTPTTPTTPTEDPNAEHNKLARQRKSVNDLIRAEMQAVLKRPELSASDRQRLDAHFQAIRDLEERVGGGPNPVAGCQISPLGEYDANNLDEVVKTQIDILALAMACGKSHVGTLCIGNGNDQTQYTIDGRVLERYHHISHRVQSDGEDGAPIPDAEELHHKIDKKFAGWYKYMLDKLSSFTTPTGTLLDDGIAVWFNDLSDGPPHGSTNVPWVLAGGAGGKLSTGNFVKGNSYTINKVHNTIAAAIGVTNSAGAPIDDFGDSSYEKGHIDGLLV